MTASLPSHRFHFMNRFLIPAATLAFLTLTLSAQSAEPVRILPLGDSITQGGAKPDEYTYRLPLFRMLKDAGVNFDFVGSRQQGLKGDFEWPRIDGEPFDTDHEGVYGIRTAKALARLPEAMKKWDETPDIAIIHLGTNDLKSPETFHEDVIVPLRDIVGLLRRGNPEVVVLLSHLHWPSGPAGNLRERVEALAAGLDSDLSPVRTVSYQDGFETKPGTDLLDGAHPGPSGSEKMARAYFEAMQPWLPEE